jgi:hypothetical protein
MGSTITSCCESIKGNNNQICEFEESKKDEFKFTREGSVKLPRIKDNKTGNTDDSCEANIDIMKKQRDNFDVDNIGTTYIQKQKSVKNELFGNSILSKFYYLCHFLKDKLKKSSKN